MRRGLLTLALLLVSSAFAGARTGLPFINDDYGKALTQAKERNKPIFVECWAPW